MKVEQSIIKRFQELIDRESQIMETRELDDEAEHNGKDFTVPPSYDYVDAELVTQWGTSSLHLLKEVFGSESDQYSSFKVLCPQRFDSPRGTKTFKKALGILKAAKDDVEHGYLFDTRVLIEAEVFSDFLEQAEHPCERGYYAPAAVVAGSVLEDGLRKLCQRNTVSLPANTTIDPMNVELAKAGVYNILIQKRITAPRRD